MHILGDEAVNGPIADLFDTTKFRSHHFPVEHPQEITLRASDYHSNDFTLLSIAQFGLQLPQCPDWVRNILGPMAIAGQHSMQAHTFHHNPDLAGLAEPLVKALQLIRYFPRQETHENHHVHTDVSQSRVTLIEPLGPVIEKLMDSVWDVFLAQFGWARAKHVIAPETLSAEQVAIINKEPELLDYSGKMPGEKYRRVALQAGLNVESHEVLDPTDCLHGLVEWALKNNKGLRSYIKSAGVSQNLYDTLRLLGVECEFPQDTGTAFALQSNKASAASDPSPMSAKRFAIRIAQVVSKVGIQEPKTPSL